MGLIASLDMGTETMVMALGKEGEQGLYLEGIKFQVTHGIDRGVIKDWEKVKDGIHALCADLLKDREVEVLNVGLSSVVLQSKEHQIRIEIQKKTVEHSDLYRAEQRCREMFKENEVVDLIPTAYVVDRGSLVDNPIGKVAKELKVIYQVYTIDYQYMSMLSELFIGFNQVCYYPSVRGYQEVVPEMKEVALVDLGAMGIQVSVFHRGTLWREAYLPLGCQTIDKDIMCAYGVNSVQARRLKHEHGEALRMLCKNRKVQIPDTNLTLESRDLATVVQCRAEELLEGVAYLLQNWEFDYQGGKILLTGGGSRLKNLDVLLQRLSGCSVERAVPCGIETSRGDLLRTPEYLLALGLLKCQTEEADVKDSLIDKVMDKLRGIFN